MATKKYVPNISKSDFRTGSASLRSDLKRKYDEAKADGAKPPLKASTKGAFDHVPDLDSKTVAKWSATFKKHLGCNLDPSLIRRGGYLSFDHFWKDIEPKLLASCPGRVQLETASVEASA